MKTGSVVLLLALCSGRGCPVDAATLPTYDVEAQCRLEDNAGVDAQANASDCIKHETADRVTAARLVAHVSSETLRRCNDIANTGDGGSYSVLAHCLKLEAVANGAVKAAVGRDAPPAK